MKMFRRLAAVLAVASIPCSIAVAENPKIILFYGNSFTLGIGSSEAQTYGGVPEVVRQLATAAGYAPPRVENAAVSGQTLAWHLSNNTTVIGDPAGFTEMPDFQWDVVVMQEYSTNPTHIGDPPGFRADAAALFGLVRSHSPAAQGVLFETWARGPGHSFYTGDPATFPGGPAQMQQELRDNYELARQELIATYGADSVIVASVGDAWEATGWDDLHAADIYHANTRGTYLTGLVIFGTVYSQRSTVGLPKLFASLTEQEAAVLQSVADGYLPPGLNFDDDGDHDIDDADVPGFVDCLAGPAFTYPAGVDCLLMDGDDDLHVDLGDYARMQASAFQLAPSLSFNTWDMVFTRPQGGGSDSQPNTVTATDASTPAVNLSAIDLITQATPTWLTVPASVSATSPFSVSVDPAGLAAGSYYARVTGSATGYDGADFTVTMHITPSGGGQTILFDFGDTSYTAGGNYNNIIYTQHPIADLIDSSGASTGITLIVSDPFYPGSNTSGTTSPSGDAAMFDPQATRDNLFGHVQDFSSQPPNPTGAFGLFGLSTAPGVSYDFTFFASRMGVSDNRETAYSVVGGNSGIGYLNASNNQTEVVTVSSIVADASGEIVVNVGVGPNNNNSTGFFYIGAVKVVRNDP